MANSAALAGEIKPAVNSIDTTKFPAVNDVGLLIYKVKAGDTLSGIVAKQYGIYQGGSRYDTALATVLFLIHQLPIRTSFSPVNS